MQNGHLQFIYELKVTHLQKNKLAFNVYRQKYCMFLLFLRLSFIRLALWQYIF